MCADLHAHPSSLKRKIKSKASRYSRLPSSEVDLKGFFLCDFSLRCPSEKFRNEIRISGCRRQKINLVSEGFFQWDMACATPVTLSCISPQFILDKPEGVTSSQYMMGIDQHEFETLLTRLGWHALKSAVLKSCCSIAMQIVHLYTDRLSI